LREESGKKGVFREIGDFVAHSEERNQGKTFDHVKRIMEKFFISPGIVKIEPIFSQKIFIDSLVAILKKQKFLFNENTVRLESKNIFKDVLEIVQEVKISVKCEQFSCVGELSKMYKNDKGAYCVDFSFPVFQNNQKIIIKFTAFRTE